MVIRRHISRSVVLHATKHSSSVSDSAFTVLRIVSTGFLDVQKPTAGVSHEDYSE